MARALLLFHFLTGDILTIDKITELCLGQLLFRHVVCSGVWTYEVIEIRIGKDSKQFVLKSLSCDPGFGGEYFGDKLLVAINDNGCVTYIHTIGIDDDDNELYREWDPKAWHSNTADHPVYFFREIRWQAKADNNKYYIKKKEDELAAAKAEVVRCETALQEHLDAVAGYQEALENLGPVQSV